MLDKIASCSLLRDEVLISDKGARLVQIQTAAVTLNSLSLLQKREEVRNADLTFSPLSRGSKDGARRVECRGALVGVSPSAAGEMFDEICH